MGVSGQRHAPAALYPWGRTPQYPLDRMLGGPQSCSGLSHVVQHLINRRRQTRFMAEVWYRRVVLVDRHRMFGLTGCLLGLSPLRWTGRGTLYKVEQAHCLQIISTLLSSTILFCHLRKGPALLSAMIFLVPVSLVTLLATVLCCPVMVSSGEHSLR
jgi:hypothetical protein